MVSSGLPQPRAGLAGMWDRLVGPGMTAGETWLVVASGSIGAMYAGGVLHGAGASWLLITVGVLLALDMFGGAVCNFTSTTKRWVHRSGSRLGEQVAFVALHVIHIGAVAWLFLGAAFDVAYFTLVAGLLTVSTALVLATEPPLRRPIAIGVFLISLILVPATVGSPAAVEWFAPVLFIKLVVGHLVPER